MTGRELRRLLAPRFNKGQLLIGGLCLLLGFAVATQVHSNHADTTFAGARQDELVGILGDLTQRADRLRGDLHDLQDTKAGLERDGQGTAAIDDAHRRAATYGILAGTVPATGPGIQLTISDPGRKVQANVLLDTLEELRDAGAEVIQINDVRAGVSTYLLDAQGGGIDVDGHRELPPYRFAAIGDPHTLATALNIPGGVLATLRSAGATGVVAQQRKIDITAIRVP